MARVDITVIGTERRTFSVEAGDPPTAVEKARPYLSLHDPVLVEITTDWPSSTETVAQIIHGVRLPQTVAPLPTPALTYLEDMADDVEYSLADLEADISPGAPVVLTPGDSWYSHQWDAFEIDGSVRLVPWRSETRWQAIWAEFGVTNLESRIGGYWRHTLGLVVPGLAAIARDEDEYGRTVELFSINDTTPAEIARTILGTASAFGDYQGFPYELIETHKSGTPEPFMDFEHGDRYYLDLHVDADVVSHL